MGEPSILQQFSLTFGLRYGDEEHPTFRAANPRGWVTVLAPDYEAARDLVHEKIGNHWAFLYPAGGFRATRYPLGEIARWSTDEPEAPKRATPDLIDPLVDLPGSYAQLTERITAALAIHNPNEYGECGHCHNHTGCPDEWPCPTALALGVPS